MASVDSLTSEINLRLGNRTGLSARILTWLNDAYFELLLSPRFTFHEVEKTATIVTVASTATYALPADLWFILNVRDDTSGTEVRKGTYRSFDRRPVTEGVPARYSRFANNIQIDPVPNDVYNLVVRYRFRPEDLVDGGVHLLGREWDEVLIVLGTVKGFEALEMTEQAAGQRNLLESMLSVRQDVRELEDSEQELQIQLRLY